MRLLLPFLLIASTVSAQIPNSGFENWTSGNPDSWMTGNVPPILTPITKSSTAYQGTGAVRGDVVSFASGIVGPMLQSGTTGAGFAITSIPASIQGYYQFSPQGGDVFGVNVILYKGGTTGTPVAVAGAQLSGAKSAYTLFTVPFQFISALIPDVCVAQFLIVNSAGGLHAGSYFLLDALSFSGTGGTSVSSGIQTPAAFALKQNYPNPFNPSTTISYMLPSSGRVQVNVYNGLGTEIAAIVDRKEEAGPHSVVFDGHACASGVYFVSLRFEGQTAVRPMLLMK